MSNGSQPIVIHRQIQSKELLQPGVENDDVETMILIWVVFVAIGLIISFLAICFIRWYYKKRLLHEIEEIQAEFEPRRAYYEEKGEDQARHVIPPTLSPPLTDQQVYYPLGRVLKDEDNGMFI